MIKYPGKFHSREDFCVVIVDDTHKYSGITKEYVKNQADYTIQNCVGMNFDVYVTRDEEQTLKQLQYEKAVVISPATEFLYGEQFFESIKGDYFLLGHLLDMGDAFYTLHPQCYVVNLKLLEVEIGQEQHCIQHRQVIPIRTEQNIHDWYTPLEIEASWKVGTYNHKLHGYNAIGVGLRQGYKILSFNEKQRSLKNYIYPDGTGIDFIHKRHRFALTELVYNENTGSDNLPIHERTTLETVVLPASGNLYEKLGDENTLFIFYDHSPTALENIKSKTKHINAEYHHIDVIAETDDFIKIIENRPGRLYIEMSNVFCFECTTPFYSLEYRKKAEEKLISFADRFDYWIHFDQRAGDIIDLPYWHY